MLKYFVLSFALFFCLECKGEVSKKQSFSKRGNSALLSREFKLSKKLNLRTISEYSSVVLLEYLEKTKVNSKTIVTHEGALFELTRRVDPLARKKLRRFYLNSRNKLGAGWRMKFYTAYALLLFNEQFLDNRLSNVRIETLFEKLKSNETQLKKEAVKKGGHYYFGSVPDAEICLAYYARNYPVSFPRILFQLSEDKKINPETIPRKYKRMLLKAREDKLSPLKLAYKTAGKLRGDEFALNFEFKNNKKIKVTRLADCPVSILLNLLKNTNDYNYLHYLTSELSRRVAGKRQNEILKALKDNIKDDRCVSSLWCSWVQVRHLLEKNFGTDTKKKIQYLFQESRKNRLPLQTGDEKFLGGKVSFKDYYFVLLMDEAPEVFKETMFELHKQKKIDIINTGFFRVAWMKNFSGIKDFKMLGKILLSIQEKDYKRNSNYCISALATAVYRHISNYSVNIKRRLGFNASEKKDPRLGENQFVPLLKGSVLPAFNLDKEFSKIADYKTRAIGLEELEKKYYKIIKFAEILNKTKASRK